MSEDMVRFLGSGDAFASGGRLQPCIHMQLGGEAFFADFGASSLIALKRYGVETSSIDTIIISHLHGDHYGGVPFLILNEHLITKRVKPLLVVGPPGLEERIKTAMEALFPGFLEAVKGFSVEFGELPERVPARIGRLNLTPFPVIHPSGAPSYAWRFECGGKVVGYSGDTEWTDALIEVATGADLFICEAFYLEKKAKNHLAYRTLMEKRAGLGCRRLVLTHMSEDVLSRLDEVEAECAEDGLRILL